MQEIQFLKLSNNCSADIQHEVEDLDSRANPSVAGFQMETSGNPDEVKSGPESEPKPTPAMLR